MRCRLSLTAVSLKGMETMAEPRPETVPDRAVLVDAMEHANLPSLVAVLYQLTGDRRCLADPYRPTRSRGMEDNDPGGFAPEIQAEIRAAAVDAVLAWAAGRPPAVPAPTGDALLELIYLAVGEPVPPEYGPMTAEDMGFGAAEHRRRRRRSDFRVVVIGAGVSGMLAAIRLAEAGIAHVVLEKNADVGGTWLENPYPGAGVDTPSHLYSFSFAPRRLVDPLRHARRAARLPRATSPTTSACASGIRVRHRGRSARRTTRTRSAWTVHRPTAGETLHRRRRDHRRRQLQPAEVPALPGWTTFARARCSTPRAGPTDLDLSGQAGRR